MTNGKIIELDLSKTNGSITSLRELVIQTLREGDLYRSDLVYRGFSRRMIDEVLTHGSENPNSRYVYANPEEHLSVDPDPMWINPLTYAKCYGALAVYRADKLKEFCFTCYEFPDLDKKAETLVAIFPLDTSKSPEPKN